MTWSYDGANYVLRLTKSELVIETLTNFVKDKKINGGFLYGLGGLVWAELGFYDLTAKAFAWTRFDEPLELLNVSGNIAWKDKKPYLHLHATVSDASQYARGGHLNEAEVNGTVELYIHVLDRKKPLTRHTDRSTGLNLLDI